MLVLGLMSGTSCDGIDVALAELRGRGTGLRISLKDFATFPYPGKLRAELLRIANANRRAMVSPHALSQVNFLLGERFAEAVRKGCRRFRVSPKRVELIGSHGHTFYHGPDPEPFAGARIGSTLQLGEAAVIAERTGIPVVSNFRARDVAAGGQGAPLVPYVDLVLYRHPRRARVALNLGGIANLTLIPAGAEPAEVIAFDSGPGNMVMDALVEHASRGKRRYDRNGRLARKGKVLPGVLKRLLRHGYFRRKPPKSTGREEFGEEHLRRFLRSTRGAALEDRMRTALEVTVRTVSDAVKRYGPKRAQSADLIAAGGGTRNRFLMKRLTEELPHLTVRLADEFGVNADAKEALAFAILAHQAWHGETATLPSATGARHAVVPGQITPATRR